ncbi:dTDP-4-dehydrorhamnose reductase [Deinococcus metalli]|uniref:dTDP-4-dehydrorhamnose reductase n=1 Tax=Deinococcus metalli TaxID=1141878 RepID=A0A7W8KD55_9DEIO|nr:NAD(P)-dependent oxidoreductase [Deinococcus metalli]MBB5375765.1 dTDP-4-dehydrorhamnose reductase [Deinococcus metalli]GHF37222.1 dTDP-4-rhamnose reductase [Deinococcus metalli]
MTVLLTGGSGRLGRELRRLMPEVVAPTSQELDVTEAAQVLSVVREVTPEVIVHAAAYTDVTRAETERAACWAVNVSGTRHVAAATTAVNAKLVHISTDYVFSGEMGGYREGDTPGPVANHYALTKLVAEEAARSAREHLIIRTSFRPRDFAYPVAFTDMYTSQDYVDVLAPLLADVIRHARVIQEPVLHVGTGRKSVYELARRRRPDVKSGLRAQAGVVLPADVSLNTERWQALCALWTASDSA